MAIAQAYSYLRVSGKSQVEGDGYPRQRTAVERYARAHGIKIANAYRDGGVSGTRELADRKGLATLLAAVQAGEVRTVLVERADRLARDLVVGEIILSQFRAAGVTVLAAEGGVDLTAADDDPTKRLIRQILGAVAEYDKTVTVLKLRAAPPAERPLRRPKALRRQARRGPNHRPHAATPPQVARRAPPGLSPHRQDPQRRSPPHADRQALDRDDCPQGPAANLRKSRIDVQTSRPTRVRSLVFLQWAFSPPQRSPLPPLS